MIGVFAVYIQQVCLLNIGNVSCLWGLSATRAHQLDYIYQQPTPTPNFLIKIIFISPPHIQSTLQPMLINFIF